MGKSTLLTEFTAWITQGDMKGEFFRQPRDVMYVANEDSLEYTLTPRLLAAGADVDRVHFIGISMLGRTANVLPKDCVGLELAAERRRSRSGFFPFDIGSLAEHLGHPRQRDEVGSADEDAGRTGEPGRGVLHALASSWADAKDLLDRLRFVFRHVRRRAEGEDLQ
ncbi:hypothetical protein ACFVDH_24505, partial [Streptomyces sp. NPDC057674]